jgi:L-asparaginase
MMTKSPLAILIIYTGGTIGMVEDPETGALHPFDFDEILKQVPELNHFGHRIEAVSFDPPIDSANMEPTVWIRLAKLLYDRYGQYDGFVILHGSDTMSYTASALSFMLENLAKPVILTGSQLPIGKMRTDGKENLVTAVEIASAQREGRPLVSEVCIYFENKLYRGNRTTKHNAEHFNAFWSANYPHLAEAGVHIRYNYSALYRPNRTGLFRVHDRIDTNVAILKIFPGISRQVVEAILGIDGLKGVVMETYGAGNAPTLPWFIDAIEYALRRGLIILNVTQCVGGGVEMGLYETGVHLLKAGVVSGRDMTTEAAVAKLMFLLGQRLSKDQVLQYLNMSIAGEMDETA